MAVVFNILYKWELIYPKGPWTGLDDVEFATMGYIDWFSHRRLHGEITDANTYVTPAGSRPPTTVKQHPPSRRLPKAGAVMEPGVIHFVTLWATDPPLTRRSQEVASKGR